MQQGRRSDNGRQCGIAGSGLENKSQEVGSERKNARRKKCKVRFSLIKKNKAFQQNYMKLGVKKLSRAGMTPARKWRVHAVETAPYTKIKIEDADGSSSGKKGHDLLFFVYGGMRP